jgi:hypothetical protein
MRLQDNSGEAGRSRCDEVVQVGNTRAAGKTDLRVTVLMKIKRATKKLIQKGSL